MNGQSTEHLWRTQHLILTAWNSWRQGREYCGCSYSLDTHGSICVSIVQMEIRPLDHTMGMIRKEKTVMLVVGGKESFKTPLFIEGRDKGSSGYMSPISQKPN